LRELVSRGESVIAVSRTPPHGARQQLVNWRMAPNNLDGWGQLLEQVSTVYHLAWSSLPQSSNDNPLRDVSDNVLGTLRLLEAAKRCCLPRLVFASSGGTVYGALSSVPANEQHTTNPRCAYGISKLAMEKYLALYQELWSLNCVALRISNAYGPGQKVRRNFGAISTFAARALKGEPIRIFGDGSIIRDYIYIDDLVEALIAAGNRHEGPRVINIGSGIGRSLNDIVALLASICTKVEVIYGAERNLDIPVSVLDISLAKRVLKWEPRTAIELGIELTANALCKSEALSANFA
jgi:UDP-glucose 4-epimerase